MKRIFPFPLMTVVLTLFWLVLNESISPGNILLGIAVGVALPIIARPMVPEGYPRIRTPWKFFRLMSFASVEIVRSCLNVSWVILTAKKEGLNSQFITVPLDIRNPYGLMLLSCLINSTPGTVWVEILPERYELALHVFDLHDAQWWIDTIKTRYEQPLIEIFEQEGIAK